MEIEPSRFPPVNPFSGAGVYALYYASEGRGYKPYERINNKDRRFKQWLPIYVGKADAPGARTGGDAEEAEIEYKPHTNLYSRLWEHAYSLDAVNNLSAEDFYYRALVLEPVWIGLGEALLIRRYRPLWNKVISGFGIHVQGKRREEQARSEWDTIHPGRDRQANPNPTSKASMLRRIGQHLENMQATSPEEPSG